MKKLIVIIAISLGTGYASVAQTGSGQVAARDSSGAAADTSANNANNRYGLFKNSFLQIDLKVVDPQKGQFGIDYNLDMKRALHKNPIKGARFRYRDIISNRIIEDTTENYINLTLASRGFVTVIGDVNPVNSLISELKIDGFPLEFDRKAPINPGAFKRTISFDDEVLIDGTENEVQNEVNQILAKVSSPFYLYPNVHVKHETTQNFEDYDIALGASVGISSEFLAKVLDLPFYLLRNNVSGNSYVQTFIHVGYDYVTGVKNTALAELRPGTNSINRLNIKGEWQTGVFTARTRIGFLYDSYYEINPSQAIKDNNLEFNRFFMIRLDHYFRNANLGDLIDITANALNVNRSSKTVYKVSLKYTQGQLPPNFTTGFVLGGGFSVDF